MTKKRIAPPAVRELCGGVSDMTIRRWTKTRGFPEAMYIAGRRYWVEADVLAWLNAQSAEVSV